MAALVVGAGLLVAFAVLGYIWTHRTGRLARGIGAAGAEYNQLYGQGAPPMTRPPDTPGAPDPNDRDPAQ